MRKSSLVKQRELQATALQLIVTRMSLLDDLLPVLDEVLALGRSAPVRDPSRLSLARRTLRRARARARRALDRGRPSLAILQDLDRSAHRVEHFFMDWRSDHASRFTRPNP